MKTHAISALAVLFALLTLCSGCGTSMEIDAQDWTLNQLSRITAEGETTELYPGDDADGVPQLTCSAGQGTFTLTDQIHGTRWQGTYQVLNHSSSGTGYTLTIDGQTGTAMVSYTRYASEDSVPTLVMQLGEYLFTFQ